MSDVVTITAACAASFASIMFALWIKEGLMKRIEDTEKKVAAIDEELDSKVNQALCHLHHETLSKEVSELKESVNNLGNKIDRRLEKGDTTMHELNIAITELRTTLANKGG